ncbi:unnamed protein product [Prorocentrum cordatum]|uniref:Uncharacterized protein n=1 Tax=Prorocentrum cordatum TaxID=2364126 RepID=A0ABN9THW2_9DINO|nr:unnamed protein product [Polarella glacialis]
MEQGNGEVEKSDEDDGDLERCGFCVVLFYLYSEDLPATLGLDGVEAVRAAHEALCGLFGLDGRLRVSREGLNGNLTAPRASATSIVPSSWVGRPRSRQRRCQRRSGRCGGPHRRATSRSRLASRSSASRASRYGLPTR